MMARILCEENIELEVNIQGASTRPDTTYSDDVSHVCGPDIGLCSPAVWMAGDPPHSAPNTYCTENLFWARYRQPMPLLPVGYSTLKEGKPFYRSVH